MSFCQCRTTLRRSRRRHCRGRGLYLQSAGSSVQPNRQRARRFGVEPGARVTLYGQNCWEWLVAYYGIVKTGAVINPINVMLTTEEVRDAVENAGARATVASQDKGEKLLDLKGTTNLRDVILWGDQP